MNPNKLAVSLRTREDVTGHQIESVLLLLDHLRPFLVAPDAREGVGPDMDGGAVMAAATTFAKATDRLDAILDDSARWDIKEINTLHEALIATHTAQQAFLAAQTKSASEIIRPSFQCRPTLYVSDGKFLAVWGDTPAIVGTGNTPNAALADFDAAFYRTSEEQVKLTFEEPIPPTPLTVKPTRKKK